MTRYQKILTAFVIALVILNAILIIFIWTHRPGTRDSKGHQTRMEIRGRMLQEKLNFSDEQKNAFRTAVKEHHQEMQSYRRALGELKSRINQAVITADSLALKQANNELFTTQQEMELASQEFTSFLSGLCDDQQRQELLRIYQNALDRKPDRRMK